MTSLIRIILFLQLLLHPSLSSPLYCTRSSTLYDILHVRPTSSTEEIRKAFYKLALLYHPDKRPPGPDVILFYQTLHEAYKTLVDPVARATYDKKLSTQNFSFMCFADNKAGNKPATPTPSNNIIELFVALQENNQAQLTKLLTDISTLGGNPNPRHPVTQETLLDVAIRTGKTSMVKLLLSYKINLNELNAYNTTALHMAVAFNRIDIVSDLIQHGAYIDATNSAGDTPLIKIAELKTSAPLTVAIMLLDAAASCDLQNENGDTALHKAALNNNTKLIALLLSHKADTMLKNKKNQTPSMVAVAYKHYQAAELLEKHQATQEATVQATKQESSNTKISDIPWYKTWWYAALHVLRLKNNE